MRSVFLIFEKNEQNNLVDFLDSYCDGFSGIPPVKQWHVWDYKKKPSRDICITIDNYPLDETEFCALIEDENSLELLLNLNNPIVWVVNISIRHEGTAELLDLVKTFLQELTGVAYVADDYTDHFWTYEELESNLKVEGHTFFDYKGWYYEKRNIKT